MDIFIDKIYYTTEEVAHFGEKTKKIPVEAHIEFLVEHNGVKLNGNLSINFDEYKQMSHNDIIEKVKYDLKNVKFP